MDIQHYTSIFEEFKTYHPYLADGIKDWFPRGEMGIRVIMDNGRKYDYNSMSKTVRNVSSRPSHSTNDYDESEWRGVFSDRLAEYMIIKGISQQSLAECAGISKGSVNKYINKQATPSAYVLTKLAEVLGCTIMDLTD